jgi:hypothetical protein
LGEVFGEAGVVDSEGAAGGAVDGEVVEADVESLGDSQEGVEAGGDAPVLVAADAAGVGAYVGGEFFLGPASFGA